MTGPKHSCGIVGISANFNVALSVHVALMIIQHRGQESAGISVSNKDEIKTIKGNGLVNIALCKEKVCGLIGNVGIGHVRYSTTGSKDINNAQPLIVTSNFGTVAISHNGDITNFAELKSKYIKKGQVFSSDSDSELIIRILERYINQYNDPLKAIRFTMNELDGAYSLVVLINNRLFGVRDPYGFRPLCLGQLNNGYIIVSESQAIDALSGRFVRDIEPGEICEVTYNNFNIHSAVCRHTYAYCMFEWVYFARPDSVINKSEVYAVRRRIGEILAKEYPIDADVVIPVPDSGRAHAIGYSYATGIPYEEGFMKNRFADRTFIMPDQKQREFAVAIKMNPIKSTVMGKRVIIVDDSIVRGTTLKKLVYMLRNAGAKEVHVRVGSPPIVAPCYYGVDMKTRDQLIANHNTTNEICKIIGADSLSYISLEGLIKAIGIKESNLCLACVNGKYPTNIPGEIHRS